MNISGLLMRSLYFCIKKTYEYIRTFDSIFEYQKIIDEKVILTVLLEIRSNFHVPTQSEIEKHTESLKTDKTLAQRPAVIQKDLK